MYNRAKRHRTAHTTAKTSLSLNGQAHASVCLFLSASCSPLGGIDHAFESSRARVARRGFATAITFRDGRCTHSLSLSLLSCSLSAAEPRMRDGGGGRRGFRQREERERETGELVVPHWYRYYTTARKRPPCICIGSSPGLPSPYMCMCVEKGCHSG